MLAICDAERPAVIAGIFGAEFAEVSEGTTRVLLESASFDGPSILDTSLALGLRSESSGRFEKGLPRELPPRAMAIACRLLVELAGARLVPGTLDVHEPPPERPAVRMRHARVPRILGVEVPVGGVGRRSSSASAWRWTPPPSGEALTARVPFERASDLTREIDLIEEIGAHPRPERHPGRAAAPRRPRAAHPGPGPRAPPHAPVRRPGAERGDHVPPGARGRPRRCCASARTTRAAIWCGWTTR